MKIRNTSETKIIGLGNINVLPGKTETVPVEFEKNPALDVYVKAGVAKIINEKPAKNADDSKETVDDTTKKADEEKAKAEKEAEELRQKRLNDLKDASEEEVAKLADELGINPADCKDPADVLKKVKAALKK